jgi:hypothetical protein
VFSADDLALKLHRVGNPIEREGARAGCIERVGTVQIDITLHAGDVTGIMLESGGVTPRQVSREELTASFLETRDCWRRWLDRSTYTGRWREAVTRSAMTL